MLASPVMTLPNRAETVIVGAGIHGLSTAWHLGERLRAAGRSDANNILVLGKGDLGDGASGIACGVVRNNYYQPAMRELMAHSVAVWESDPKSFSYHPVGYMQISCEAMHAGVSEIAQQQRDIGYESVFIEGEDDCMRYMRGIFDDWQARGITSVLHEKKGGYANNQASLRGLLDKARSQGVRVETNVEVLSFHSGSQTGAVTAVETTHGIVECSQVVLAVGPWIRGLWANLDLPSRIDVRRPDGTVDSGRPMWTYWSLQEGTLGVDPKLQRTNDGEMPPVLHVDTDAPLYSDHNGALLTEQLWGIYYKPDFNFGGVQGGALPFPVDREADEVAVDPYGPASPDFVVGPRFADQWTSGLAFCQKRFVGKSSLYKQEPSGGIGCLTPDSFPVFDRFRDNVYVIADANHGYKMIGVGQLVADELLGGRSTLLDPFRFGRFEQGRLHPVSNSPFPWS